VVVVVRRLLLLQQLRRCLVVDQVAQQRCRLQRVVGPAALTQRQRAADRQPAALPYAVCQLRHEAAAVDGREVAPQVLRCTVAAPLLRPRRALLRLLLRGVAVGLLLGAAARVQP
jgi:hypothetical protein